MFKRIVTIGFVAFLLLIGVFFLFFKVDDLRILPTSCNTVFYTDEVDNGNSEIIKKEVGNESIRFLYQLKNHYAFPYCGLGLEPKNTSEWDFSVYNKIKITIKSYDLSSVYVFLHTYDENVADKGHRLALRRMSHNLKLVPGKTQTVTLNLDEFETATWWYSLIQQDKSDFGAPDVSKTRSIHFMSGLNKVLNKTVGYEVYEVAITNNYSFVYLLLGSAWCCVMVVCWVYLKKLKTQPRHEIVREVKEPLFKSKVEIAYKPIETGAQVKESYLDYINTNFQNPDLNLSMVSEITGYSERTISNFISENYSCNFKSYINNIRVNEAKRLLEQGIHNSGEVAYLVGFNSPANFNRVFKSIVGSNPTEYLQNAQKL